VSQYGRYGTPRITAVLKRDGFKVNHKRVERIWRQQGLKVAKKQKKRRRLWLNDGSTIRLRPQYKDHVWSYDILVDKTYNGKKFRILNIIDEYSRECLLSYASRRITSNEVVEFLADLFCLIARHARLSEILYLALAAATAYLRLAGLTSFPGPHP
jgi:transposase InsO family protein